MFKNMFKRRGDSVQHLAEISKVNAILDSGKTLDYLDKSKLLGCKKKVYLDRAEKQGFKYNPLENKFVEIQPRANKEVHITPPKEIKIGDTIIQNKDKVTQSDTTRDNYEVTQDITTHCKDEVIQSDTTQDKDITIENILTRLKILEDKVLQSVTPPSCTFILNEKLKDIEIVTRGIKVDKNALTEFDNLASTRLAQFTKQELLSQALLEFVDRYK